MTSAPITLVLDEGVFLAPADQSMLERFNLAAQDHFSGSTLPAIQVPIHRLALGFTVGNSAQQFLQMETLLSSFANRLGLSWQAIKTNIAKPVVTEGYVRTNSGLILPASLSGLNA